VRASRPFRVVVALLIIGLSGCFPAEGVRKHVVTGRLVAPDGTPLAGREVVVAAERRRVGRTPEEQLAWIAPRAAVTTDEAGRFAGRTRTMSACLANALALIVVGIPVLVTARLTHRGARRMASSRALCILLCTGVGCGAPKLRDPALLIRDADVVRVVPLTVRFTGLIDETRSVPDGPAVVDEVACHDAGDVVLIAPTN
jgi:hypothetical protein